jgi:hypothetical protein
MQLVGTQVIPERGGKAGFTVEFVGSSGEVVSVQLRNDSERSLNSMNAVEQAKAVMVALAASDTSKSQQGVARNSLTGDWKIRFPQAIQCLLRRPASRLGGCRTTDILRWVGLCASGWLTCGGNGAGLTASEKP